MHVIDNHIMWVVCEAGSTVAESQLMSLSRLTVLVIVVISCEVIYEVVYSMAPVSNLKHCKKYCCVSFILLSAELCTFSSTHARWFMGMV